MTIHLNSKQRSDLKEVMEYMESKRKRRPPFFNAWLLIALGIIAASIPFWRFTVNFHWGGESHGVWWWLIGAAVYVLGARSYQYFKQGR